MSYTLGAETIVDAFANMIIGVFGSPVIAGLFLLGFVTFILIKLGVPTDGMIVVFGMAITTLFVAGVGTEAIGIGSLLFYVMIIIMLGIVGYSLVKIFNK